MKHVKYKKVGDGYVSIRRFVYHSLRYNKTVTVPAGFYSDGATSAPDIDTDAWWVHDVLCRFGCFDDGSKCTNWQASTVLHDILKEDGFWVRAVTWRWATYMFGGGAAREGKTYDQGR